MTDAPRGRDWVARTLTDLRKAAGLSGSRAGELAGIQQSKVSRIESGEFLPNAGEIRDLCSVYRAVRELREAAGLAGSKARFVPDPDEVRALRQLGCAPEQACLDLLDAERDLRAGATRSRTVLSRGSWRMQQRVARLEARSQKIWVYQPALIPGLLQTADYMRLVFAERMQGPDLDRAVATRMERARVLDSGREFTFILPAGALDWQAGGPALMAAQMEHIIGVTLSHGNVRTGVIGQEQAAEVFTTHGFSLYDGRTAIVGIRTGTSFETRPDAVAELAEHAAGIEGTAVFGDKAIRILRDYADGYQARA